MRDGKTSSMCQNKVFKHVPRIDNLKSVAGRVFYVSIFFLTSQL